MGVEILSTGGTARALAEAGVAVVEVADYTGFPEMMAGRVKTLHPKIHGGLLGRRGVDDAVMREHGVRPIDLVAVNLYPFAATVARPDCDLATAIENIDIGGPAMLRSAAKNHAAVAVLVDPADYYRVLTELDGGGISAASRFELACKTFAHTARYDGAIANYLGGLDGQQNRQPFPTSYSVQFRRTEVMRYGENPHQQAALYADTDPTALGEGIATARQLAGKALSYNNVADADAALQCVAVFEQPACVIVKHANPCGVAQADTPLDAYLNAYRTDPTSAFGGIIAFNRSLDAATAEAVLERQFVEVVIAPAVEPDTVKLFAAKPKVRLLTARPAADLGFDYKRVGGGLLLQQADHGTVRPRSAARGQPSSARGRRARRPAVRLAGGQVR